MAAINDLVAQIKDEALRWQIEAGKECEITQQARQDIFGQHQSDVLPLYAYRRGNIARDILFQSVACYARGAIAQRR